MRHSRTFHEEAAAEFDEAAAHYAVERASLSETFISAVEEAVALAQRHPEAAPVVRGRVRSLRVERFPYSLKFSVVDESVRVLAVAHDRRRPFYGEGRR